MIITIKLDELDVDIAKFYENEENMLYIKDALIHGYKIVNSDTYALNLKNTNQNHTQKIDDLSKQNQQLLTELRDIKIAKQIEIDQNSQKLSSHFSNLQQELEQNFQKKLLNQFLIKLQEFLCMAQHIWLIR